MHGPGSDTHRRLNSSERSQDQGRKVKSQKVQVKGHKGETKGHKVKLLSSPGYIRLSMTKQGIYCSHFTSVHLVNLTFGVLTFDL